MFILIFFVLGAIFGSFLNCLIYRINEEKTVLGRSFCTNCNTTLRFFDLVPIFSYIFLLGRCRYCKSKFSIEHVLVEFILGTLFAFGYWFFFMSSFWIFGNLIFSYIFYLLLLLLLSFIFIYDLKYYLIVDVVAYFGIFVSLIFNIFIHKDFYEMLYGLILGLCFFGLQYLISRGRWLGSGDIILGCFMGVLLGLKISIVALFLTYFLGAIISILLLLLKIKDRSSKIPLGPFISLAMLISFLWGQSIFNWYINIIGL